MTNDSPNTNDPAAPVNADEVRKFAAMADRWWDPSGPMAPLHAMNPWRIDKIRRIVGRRFGTDDDGRLPLAGRTLLDVGCGAGLFCEPMARLGAVVTGIDPAEGAIAVARSHAEQQELEIDYRVGAVDDIDVSEQRFDVVTALEVVEHSEDPAALVRAAAARVADGGLLIISTIARTNLAWLEAIVAAEYLLRWLPTGTHQFKRLVKASELARWMRASGLAVTELRSVTYDPRSSRFVDKAKPDVNYLMVGAKG